MKIQALFLTLAFALTPALASATAISSKALSDCKTAYTAAKTPAQYLDAYNGCATSGQTIAASVPQDQQTAKPSTWSTDTWSAFLDFIEVNVYEGFAGVNSSNDDAFQDGAGLLKYFHGFLTDTLSGLTTNKDYLARGAALNQAITDFVNAYNKAHPPSPSTQTPAPTK